MIAAIILFCSTLAWFYIFHTYLLDLSLESFGVDGFFFSISKLLFYSMAVVAGIVGSLLAEKFDRTKFTISWIAIGLLTTLSLVFFTGSIFALIASSLLGISFGLGFPVCQAFLTESTKIESRGKIAGLSIFLTFVTVVAVLLIASVETIELTNLIIISVILKIVSFAALFIAPIGREKGAIKPWGAIVTSKDFTSYAVPWLIFNIANGILLFGGLSEEIQLVATLGQALMFIAIIIAAIAAGLLADRYGRKQPMLLGLVSLGIGYVLFGLINSPATYLIYATVEGVAWGLIAVSYLLVILGDMASPWGSKERFFALGGLTIPLLTRSLFEVAQEWTGLKVGANTLSSILSIAIFICVIPVLRAPETLSDKKIKEKRLKEHLEKVGKLIEESKKK